MSAQDHLQGEQFSGWMPLKSIKPTESSIPDRYGVTNPHRRTNEAGMEYAADMRDHIAEHGFTMGPLEVTYGKRFGNERKDSTYLTQGHHRYWAAQQLGMTHVPVEGVNRTGVPVPGLLPERP
jgi:hypothetical protein